MTKTDYRISIVVPAFNESRNLRNSLDAIRQHLDSGGFDAEIIVVDDGSTDDTVVVAQSFADDHSEVKVIRHLSNLGLGQALKSGFRAATGDYVVTFDADLSYSPDHIDRLVETIVTTGAKVVAASPYMQGGTVTGVPKFRALLSRTANRVLKSLSLSHVTTVTGMVRAYERDFIDGLSLKSVDNQINAEIIYKTGLLRERVVEIPAHLVWTRDEEDTRQRRRYFSVVVTTVDFLFSGFIFRPFAFFVLPGLLASLLAAYSLGWALFHVYTFYPDQTGNLDARLSLATAEAFVSSPHSFVIGGLALIGAFQLISLGLLSAQNKRYFEDLFFQGNRLSRELHARPRDGESESGTDTSR